MSQDQKSSSAPQTRSSTYVCVGCKESIIDHVYLVQRRRIRPTKETSPSGKTIHNPPDLIDTSHAGVILGPEHDPYCTTCYMELPTLQDLINAHKKRVDSSSKNLA